MTLLIDRASWTRRAIDSTVDLDQADEPYMESFATYEAFSRFQLGRRFMLAQLEKGRHERPSA